MAVPQSSRLPGFYRLDVEQRRAKIADLCQLTPQDVSALDAATGLSTAVADKMIENVVGTFSLPIGLGLNFLIDGQDYIVPMVVEEPSVVAAVSNSAALVRATGGFSCSVDAPVMIAQVQLVEVPDCRDAAERIEAQRARLVARGNELAADMVRFGGGMRGLETRVLPDPGDGGGPMLVVHLLIDCRDAMGANTVNTVAEGLAPELELMTGGRAVLRILSNLADRRLARAQCRVPLDRLDAGPGLDGIRVAENIVWAYRLADRDPYRAATHNKGVLNGIDAVAIATGNDWRSVEAAAHAFAARDGRYRSLTRYRIQGAELLCDIELPMAVGTVGGSIGTHPTVRACRAILGAGDAASLAKIMAAVGLAQNLGALRALAGAGIQRGHMALHARQIALAAGATADQVEIVARSMIERHDIREEVARQLLAQQA